MLAAGTLSLQAEAPDRLRITCKHTQGGIFAGTYLKTGQIFEVDGLIGTNCWNREGGGVAYSFTGLRNEWFVLKGADCPRDTTAVVFVADRTTDDPTVDVSCIDAQRSLSDEEFSASGLGDLNPARRYLMHHGIQDVVWHHHLVDDGELVEKNVFQPDERSLYPADGWPSLGFTSQTYGFSPDAICQDSTNLQLQFGDYNTTGFQGRAKQVFGSVDCNVYQRQTALHRAEYERYRVGPGDLTACRCSNPFWSSVNIVHFSNEIDGSIKVPWVADPARYPSPNAPGVPEALRRIPAAQFRLGTQLGAELNAACPRMLIAAPFANLVDHWFDFCAADPESTETCPDSRTYRCARDIAWGQQIEGFESHEEFARRAHVDLYVNGGLSQQDPRSIRCSHFPRWQDCTLADARAEAQEARDHGYTRFLETLAFNRAIALNAGIESGISSSLGIADPEAQGVEDRLAPANRPLIFFQNFAGWTFGSLLNRSYMYSFLFDDDPADQTLRDAVRSIHDVRRIISPALTKLRSTGVRFVPGQRRLDKLGVGTTPFQLAHQIPLGNLRLGAEDPRIRGEENIKRSCGDDPPEPFDPYLMRVTDGRQGSTLPQGDVLLGAFQPVDEIVDGPSCNGQRYFMVTNARTEFGSPQDLRPTNELFQQQWIELQFDADALERDGILDIKFLHLRTGRVQTLPWRQFRRSFKLNYDPGLGILYKYGRGESDDCFEQLLSFELPEKFIFPNSTGTGTCTVPCQSQVADGCQGRRTE